MGAGIADQLPPIPMSPLLGQTLARAAEYAQQQSHAEVSLEHLLLALTEDDAARQVMESSGVNIAALQTDVSQHVGRIEQRIAPGEQPTTKISEELRRILNAAAIAARAGRRNSIDGAIVLAAIIGDAKTSAAGLLRAHGLTFEVAIDAIRQVARNPANAQPAPSTGPAPEETTALPSGEPPSQTSDILANARARIASRRAAGYSEQFPKTEEPAAEPPPATGAAEDETVAAPPSQESGPQTEIEQGQPPLPPAPPSDAKTDSDKLSADLSSLIVAASTRGPNDRTVAQTSIEPVSEENPLQPPKPPPPIARAPTPPPPPPPAKKEEAPAPPAPAPATEDKIEVNPPLLRPTPPRTPPPPAGGPPPQQPAWTPPAGDTRTGGSNAPQPTRGAPPPMPPNAPMRPPAPAGGPPPRRESTWAPPPGSPDQRGAPPHPGSPPGAPGQKLPSPEEVFGQRPPPPNAGSPPGEALERARQQKPADPTLERMPHPTLTGGPPAAAPAAKRSHETPAILPGQLVENVPRRMRVGISSPVEVRIAKAEVKAISEGLDMGVTAFRHDIQVTKAMSVRLRAPEGGFFIETASPETQWIENALGLMADDFARWRWNVTPKLRGKRRLQLIISARTVGPDGLAAETSLPDQVIEIKVATNYATLFKRTAGWAIAAVLGGLLAKFGAQIWIVLDPIMKSLMQLQ